MKKRYQVPKQAAPSAQPPTPPPPPLPVSQRRKPRKSEHPVRRFALYTLLAVAGLITGLGLFVFSLLSQPLRTDIGIVDAADYAPVSLDDIILDDEQDNLPWREGGRTRVYVKPGFDIRKVAQKDPKIENVLVFGIDARSSSEVVSRADSIVIVTIDQRHDAIKLTSVMRDTQVHIEGRSQPEKINAAYAYGGVGLLINTLNETLDLDIQRFAMFDFWSAATLIDAVGGVEIEVSQAEIPHLNSNLREQLRLIGSPGQSPDIASPGTQMIDGNQAIAWARIRALDSDVVRTSRQRTVMTAMIDEFSDASATTLLSFANSGLSTFETNMRNADMIRIGLNGLPVASKLVEYRLPQDGFFTVQPNPWMMIVDWDRQLPVLHDFIWGDVE